MQRLAVSKLVPVRQRPFRPIIGTITKPPFKLDARLIYESRAKLLCGELGFQWIPEGHAPKDQFLKLGTRVSHLPPSEGSKAPRFSNWLIAGMTPLVGPDCMSVVLPRAIMGPILL